MAKTISCPSCGGPIELKSAAAVMVVCPYCDSSCLRQDVDLELIGKMGQLMEDGSPVQLGTRGIFQGTRFEVVGRIQLEYPQGYWNEWFLSFDDGRTGWMGEAQGSYAVSFPAGKVPLPPLAALKPGKGVPIGTVMYEVRDVQKARCVGGEGELPFQVGTGWEVPTVDLVGPGTQFATLDYSDEKPVAYVGENLDFDELSLSDLREIEGW